MGMRVTEHLETKLRLHLCVCVATSLCVPWDCWAEARIKIARMSLTIKLDGNWSSFQVANSAPPLSVTDSAIAPFRKDTMPCCVQIMFVVQTSVTNMRYWCFEMIASRTLKVWHIGVSTQPMWENLCYPRRVCRTRQCAMPVQHVEVLEQAHRIAPPKKNICDKQDSSWSHISCHTDKNRYHTWS